MGKYNPTYDYLSHLNEKQFKAFTRYVENARRSSLTDDALNKHAFKNPELVERFASMQPKVQLIPPSPLRKKTDWTRFT